MIRIAFSDFWSDFDVKKNFITHALDGIGEYEIVEGDCNPDFLVYSTFSNDFLNYNCPRIFFTGENCVPDFNLCDYAIGFDEMSFGDRYIRYPLYAACYKDDFKKAIEMKQQKIDITNKQGFCSMVVSNGNTADTFRDELFEELSNKYSKVYSGGKYKNNIGMPNGVNDKLEFIGKYRFNLACENVAYPGYCTEKIIQAFAAGTVPIYWGDPNVETYFNKESFINLNDCKDVKEAIDKIIRVDSDMELYERMLNAKILNDEKYSLECIEDNFAKWLKTIVLQPVEKRYRRTRTCFNLDYENHYKELIGAYEYNQLGWKGKIYKKLKQ